MKALYITILINLINMSSAFAYQKGTAGWNDDYTTDGGSFGGLVIIVILVFGWMAVSDWLKAKDSKKLAATREEEASVELDEEAYKAEMKARREASIAATTARKAANNTFYKM